MNWTGGKLCRSRNANSSVSAKQKNHFAKVRANLQSTHSSSPKRRQPFDLDHWRPEYETRHLSPSASSPQHGHLQRQTILDNFENVRPLVKKLQTLNQLNDSHKRKRPSIEHRAHHIKMKDSGDRAVSPIVISSRPSSASSTSSASAEAANKDRPRLDTLETSGLPSIEAKRRRLLQMEDWVGVERKHSKPPHMTFTAAEDRDMIGKRRQMKKAHHVTRDAAHRSSKRNSYLEGPRHLDIPSQNFDVSQMSIRIGSAVDRSQASVSSGEMLFDSEVQAQDRRRLPAAPVIQPGELGSLPLSDQTHHEILGSSDFMDDLSSVVAVLQPEGMGALLQPHNRHRDINTSSGTVDNSSSFDFIPRLPGGSPPKEEGLRLPILDKDNSETSQERDVSTPLELERAQEEQGFRLVFENTPQPPGSNWTNSDPVVRDFAYPVVGPPLAPLKMSPPSRVQDVSTPYDDAEADDSPFESLGSRPSSLGSATNHTPEYHASTGRRPHIKSSDQFAGKRDLRTDQESSEVPENEMRSPARDEDLDKDKLQPNGEEESIWRSFTMLDEMEDTKSFKARPTSNNTGKEPPTNRDTNHNAQSSTPKPKRPSPIDEEEQIWRAFIFSDDDDDNNPTNEWTLEPSPQDIQSSTPSNPTQTQPSMLAEASTSPLKHHPYLHEASPPVISPSEVSDQLEQGFDSATSHSSDILAEVSSSAAEDPLGFPGYDTVQSERARTSSEESKPVQRPRGYTFTPWTDPSPAESDETQTERQQRSSLSAHAPTTISSSLSAQAPSIYSSSPTPPILSSDPLHGPSPHPVAIPNTITLRSEPRVVFTPPKRYTAPRAIKGEERIALRRGVRGRKRKGKGKGKGRRGGGVEGDEEGEGDEIVDK